MLEHGWVPVSNIWTKLSPGDSVQPLRWTNNARELTWDYLIPNVGQCAACHTLNDEMVIIGPEAKWLNGPYADEDGVSNQLTKWQQAGILVGAPTDPSKAPKQAVWDDESTGSLEARAKAYLDINCAHCHMPGGHGVALGFISIPKTR